MIPKKYQDEYGQKLIDFILNEFAYYNINFEVVSKKTRWELSSYIKNNDDVYDLWSKVLVVVPSDENITIKDKPILEAFVNDCTRRFLEQNPPDSNIDIKFVEFHRGPEYSIVDAFSLDFKGGGHIKNDNWENFNGLNIYVRLREKEIMNKREEVRA